GLTIGFWRLPRLRAPGLGAALDRGEYRGRAVFRDQAAFLGGGEQVIAHLVLLFVELAAGHELENAERGAVERVVSAAVLLHDSNLGAFVPQRRAAVDRTTTRLLCLRFAAGLAIGLAVGFPAQLAPTRAPHDLARLGDEATSQRFI